MAVGKRLRFEVFKRDKFTCQYCGRKAPEVLLHVDHIEPRAEGGDDTLLNLTTSCEGCNLGKGPRRLADDSAVQKQRTQLEELQERQEQIALMIEWQRSLKNIEKDTTDSMAELWEELAPGFRPNARGRQGIAKAVRQFGVEEVAAAMRIAAENYLRYDDAGEVTNESWEMAFNKIPGICRTRRAAVEKPYIRDIHYIRGILRNRHDQGLLTYLDWDAAFEWLDTAFSWGAAPAELQAIARSAGSWSRWRDEMVDVIDRLKSAPDA